MITKTEKSLHAIIQQILLNDKGRKKLEENCTQVKLMINAYLTEKIECVQKRARARRTLFPEKHYFDALSCANVTRLDVRRDGLCLKLWHNIQAVLDSRLHHLLRIIYLIREKRPCLDVEQKGSKKAFSQQYRIDSVSVKYLNY